MGEVLIRILIVLWGFLKVWVRSVLHLQANHGLFVEPVVKDLRMDKCQVCPKYREDIDLCSVCFCKMTLKTRLIESQCPEGKW